MDEINKQTVNDLLLLLFIVRFWLALFVSGHNAVNSLLRCKQNLKFKWLLSNSRNSRKTNCNDSYYRTKNPQKKNDKQAPEINKNKNKVNKIIYTNIPINRKTNMAANHFQS